MYNARALYAMYDNSVFFDDFVICELAVGNGEERSLKISQPDTAKSLVKAEEYVKLYPNPAKEVLNLSFYAQTTGIVEFVLLDELGEPVIQKNLGTGQTFAQYSTGSLSSALYIWQLKDSEHIIQSGKVAITK